MFVVGKVQQKERGTEMLHGIEIKYPDIEVKLVGEDGNAFAIMGRVMNALKSAGVSKEEVDAYYAESTSGDYEHLIATAANWVTVY
jgi:hypothetical protein